MHWEYGRGKLLGEIQELLSSLEGWVGRSRAHESVRLRQESFWSLESCGLKQRSSKYCLSECVVFTV